MIEDEDGDTEADDMNLISEADVPKLAACPDVQTVFCVDTQTSKGNFGDRMSAGVSLNMDMKPLRQQAQRLIQSLRSSLPREIQDKPPDGKMP